MHTVDHKPVRIIDQGILNTDAGPDFFNATVEIDHQTWVGNVEIHVRASDWFRHHHDTDPAYDSVILHVVQIDDAPVHRKNGARIPQMVMKCSPEGSRQCNRLIEYATSSLPCHETIVNTPHIYHTDWLTSLGAERLYAKSERVRALVAQTDGDWEAATFITFSRALGFGLNAEPMETLARHLPLRFLNRHRDEFISVEAFIFGQAGMIPLPDANEDPYITRLRQEYSFLANKYTLHPLPLSWKFSRTRPQNFPYRRLALLAHKVHMGFYLMGELHEAKTIEEMRKIFDVSLMGYWATHFSFGKETIASTKALSQTSIDTLIINTAIPLRHAYATYRGDIDTLTENIELLQQLPPENNTITRLFENGGLKADNAFDTQAMIQLRREYCEKKKCIYCRIGQKMLSQALAKNIPTNNKLHLPTTNYHN